ncbi:hypothetical protein [Streptomyces sp. 8N616]|uniref:hypothetical protein n=1 Tax=Streptomyces sp. 8N616 TaxID=3457414 RepID=UPI003FD4406A
MSPQEPSGWNAPGAGGYGQPPAPPPQQPYPNPQAQPYGYQQPQPYPQPQSHPQQAGYGPYGPPPPGPYATYPPGPGYPAVPGTMPGQVRTAQVMFFVLAGLVLVGSAAAGAIAGGEAAGKVIGSNLPVIGGFICALLFGKSGNGARITAIVFGSLMILFGLGALGQEQPAGLLEIACGIVIIVMLGQKQATYWFTRPRA